MRYLGIDPGLKGAFALIADDEPPLVVDMPLRARDEVDEAVVWGWLGVARPDAAAMEATHAFPGIGARANWTICENWATVRTILRLRHLTLAQPLPQQWQKAVGLVLPPLAKREKLPKGATPIEKLEFKRARDKAKRERRKVIKERTMSLARDLFPTAELDGKDGRADALLLAEYARRLRVGGA